MAFSAFFRSEISDLLIRVKVTKLELSKIQADLERLLILDQDSAFREAKELMRLEKLSIESQNLLNPVPELCPKSKFKLENKECKDEEKP